MRVDDWLETMRVDAAYHSFGPVSGHCMMVLGRWAVDHLRASRAISMYLATRRSQFMRKLPRRRLDKDQKRNELLRLARRAFRLESAEVQALYLRRADARRGGSSGTVSAVRRRLRGKQAAPANGGSGGVEASGGIQASHGDAKNAPTTPPIRPIRCRSSSPGPVQWQTRCEEVPSMKGDLCVPDAHTRDEAQAVGGGQHDPRTSAPDQRDVGMWGCKSAHDQQMLACGDVKRSQPVAFAPHRGGSISKSEALDLRPRCTHAL